jgi:hypothetical protein
MLAPKFTAQAAHALSCRYGPCHCMSPAHEMYCSPYCQQAAEHAMERDYCPCGHTCCASHSSGGKVRASAAGAFLLSFLGSALATFLICALIPVEPISFPLLPQDLRGSGRLE